MARRETPCVVGLAPRLEVRRNSERPGAVSSTWSRREEAVRSWGLSRIMENAASPAAAGRLMAPHHHGLDAGRRVDDHVGSALFVRLSVLAGRLVKRPD